MANVSVMTSNRVRISRTVCSSVRVHGAEVAPQLDKVLSPDQPISTSSAIFLALLDAVLQRASETVVAADAAYQAERADDAGPRAARDLAAAALRQRLISISGVMDSVYGPAILPDYGLGGETPDDPDQLLLAADNTAKLLRQKQPSVAPKMPGVTCDPGAAAAALAADAATLRQSLDDVKRESRELQSTLIARDNAVAAWNHVYQGAATAALSGLYRLAGRQDLADSVRPTARRRAGLPEDVDEEAAADTETTTPPPAEADPGAED